MRSNNHLERVRAASVARRASEAEYLLALASAIEAGASYANVARAAGVTRQAVRQTVTRLVSSRAR